MDELPPKLQELLTYCRTHNIHGTYRVKQEGPNRWRAYIRTDKCSTNGIDETREKALDRIAANVLEGLTNPKAPKPGGMEGAYRGIYGKRISAPDLPERKPDPAS